MYLTNIKKLEEQIVTNTLFETDSYHYLTAYLVVSSLDYVSISTSIVKNPNTGFSIFATALIMLTNVYGVTKLFELNKKYDNKDFIKRVLSVLWVISFRLTLYFLPLYFIIEAGILSFISGFEKGVLESDAKISNNPIIHDTISNNSYLIASILMEILVFYYSFKSFRRISTYQLTGSDITS